MSLLYIYAVITFLICTVRMVFHIRWLQLILFPKTDKPQSLYSVKYLLSWFKSYITGRRQFVSLFDQKSAEYLVTSGVPQGGHLSPLLFNIVINTLYESVDSKMLLFADDVKIFSCVQSESDAISLQKSLNKLVHSCNTVGLELAIHKFKVMYFSRRHSIIQYDYSIDNVMLQRKNQVEDLGFIFTPTLSFAPHIDWMVGKALRSLGFIR